MELFRDRLRATMVIISTMVIAAVIDDDASKQRKKTEGKKVDGEFLVLSI